MRFKISPMTPDRDDFNNKHDMIPNTSISIKCQIVKVCHHDNSCFSKSDKQKELPHWCPNEMVTIVQLFLDAYSEWKKKYVDYSFTKICF